MDYGLLNSVPNSLTLYATPVRLQERLKANLGLFVQDQWTLQDVTLNLGLRFDYFNGFVPRQQLEAGPFVPERDFARVDCVPCWKDINPRLGAAWNLSAPEGPPSKRTSGGTWKRIATTRSGTTIRSRHR
jgi:outer membrane receptor protein involved in Fe transport